MDSRQTDEAGEQTRSWRDLWVVSQDGLKLHARDYGPRRNARPAVICLPGLTRSARDFHALAEILACAEQGARRVVVFELRGRGQSEYDRDARNYNVQRETLDVLDVMAASGLESAVVVGTSRGGLIAMTMAVARPSALLGAILNDVGPRIEAQGLMRIVSQLTRMPKPASWDDAAAIMRRMFEESFTDLTDDDWMTFAREIFRDENDAPKSDFDPRVIQSLKPDDIADGLVPEMWAQFDALRHVPVLAIRGANSDILAAQTLSQMASRHPDLTAVTVPNRGHAPSLREPVSLAAIDAFLARIDALVGAV